MLVRSLFYFGLIGPLLFIAVFTIEGLRRPGYNPVYHMVSSLSSGPNGWIQIANFIICGASILSIALGLGVANITDHASIIGITMASILGTSLIAAGVFVTDSVLGYPKGAESKVSRRGQLHNLFSLIVFGSVPFVILIMAFVFKDAFDWNGWFAYSITSMILFTVTFLAFISASVLVEIKKLKTAPIGLLQRLTIIIGWTWISIFSYLLSQKLT
jgi:hypothetical protein